MKNPILLLFFFTVCFYGQQDSDYWLNQADLGWTENDSLHRYNEAEEPCNLGTTNDRCGQNMYYSGWAVSYLLDAFRKTGNVKYLNELIDFHYIYKAKSSTVNINGTNYVGWPAWNANAQSGKEDIPNGSTLWESYFYRYPATAMRSIMDDTALLATTHNQPGSVTWPGTTYQDIYDDIKGFIEVNIWDKFEDMGWGSIYRSRVHMTSHWARLAMELHEMTGKQKYLDAFNNMTHDGFPDLTGVPSERVGESFEGNSFYNNTNYLWDMDMDNTVNSIQDTDHSLDVAQFFAEAYWLNELSSTDYFYNSTHIEGLKETFLNYLYVSPLSNGRDTKNNIDGTGGSQSSASVSGWYMLSGWEPEVSTFINSELTDRTDIDPSSGNIRRASMIGSLVIGLSIREGTNHYPLTSVDTPISLLQRRLKKDSETIGF